MLLKPTDTADVFLERAATTHTRHAPLGQQVKQRHIFASRDGKMAPARGTSVTHVTICILARMRHVRHFAVDADS